MIRLIVIIGLTLFAVLLGKVCLGQSSRMNATIEVSAAQKGGRNHQITYLNGYNTSIHSQTIAYHSSHPDAESALLVRARQDARSISWLTDSLPKSFSGMFYEFIWLAGIECKGWGEGTPTHEFKMYINNELWFTFTNRKDETAMRWTISGKDGGELAFDSRMVDKYGDLFGYMYLKLPKASFKYGSPLTIRVDGENADSPDWYMTFEYRFKFVPHFRSEPVLIRGDGKITQQLRISLDNLEHDRIIAISISGRKVLSQPMAIGANIFRVPMSSVTSDIPMDITFIRDKRVIDRSTVFISPVPKRDVYVLPYSHNDIGYTDLQTKVEQKQWANLDQALALIRQTKDYPVESRFKWNMEVLWPLESYLHKATPERRQEVVEDIRNGSIGLNALYVNPLTGLATSTEMAHFLDYAREFSEESSVPILSATVSDVPGFTWGIVSALSQNGIKYFGSAPNTGDRIGYVIDQWGDKPFYWKSQSGQERVLFWVAGSGYSTFHQGTLVGVGPDMIMKLGRNLIESKYPYDMYYLPYTIGDNGGPDTTLAPFVKAWNEQYVTPTLIIATHDQMFKAFEKKYGGTLPTFGGDFTPYWEDGAASTAHQTALGRHAVDRLIQAGAIWSMRAPDGYPKQLADDAWRDIVLWDEHTWGADKSVTNPDDPMTIDQWKIKDGFVLKADTLSKMLMTQALAETTVTSQNEIPFEVYNTNSWYRSDLVLFGPEMSAVGDKVVEENGKTLLSQRLSTGELAVMIEKIAPFSSKRILVQKGTGTREGTARASGDTVENGLLTVRVDPESGAISSLRGRSASTEFVDSKSGYGLNHYIYVPGKNSDSAQYLSHVRISVREKGPLVASLLVEGNAPGCDSFASEIRVIHGLNRVDIINRLQKKAIRTKEGLHYAFPFNIPGGTMHYDVASGIIEPGKDQLPGSCRNFYSVVSWVDVSNENSGITWTTSDAPLIEIGAITAEVAWMKTSAPSTSFYSYALNNYWHTNYKADQSGPMEFHYSLFPHSAYDPAQATRLGHDARQPLVVSQAGGRQPGMESLLQITPETIVAESAIPIGNGKSWLLYLYNPSASPADVRIIWNRREKVSLSLCDGFGKPVSPVASEFAMPAWATQYVRIEYLDK
jgi:alpha-mannosidase